MICYFAFSIDDGYSFDGYIRVVFLFNHDADFSGFLALV